MKIVRKAARELSDADGATFVLKDVDKCYYADEDAISPLWKGNRFPMHSCVSGMAMMTKEAIVIPDIYEDPRIPIELYRPTFVRSMAMTPIRKLDPIGAIGTYWAKQYQPTQDQLYLLQALADITAVSLENINVYNELEQRVKDRTLQLEALNKDLNSFSYSVSHDLRAPLRAISGYIGILNEDHATTITSDGKQLMSRISSRAKDMDELINSLLEFAQMGQREIVRSKVKTREQVEDIVRRISEQEKEKKIDFVIHELPDMAADPKLMQQVWTNLISNAVKYSSKRETIRIEIGATEKDGMLVYSVKDNGCGFDMKYYDKLFGVFQRLHTKAEFEGTGIGLANVSRIVGKHGGRVWAEAKVDEGATFCFSLPRELPGGLGLVSSAHEVASA